MSRYVNINVDVEVDLADIYDEDLIDELERRNLEVPGGFSEPEATKALIIKIWHQRRCGKDYQKEIDELIYASIGKIV
jgi:hypothetical protein